MRKDLTIILVNLNTRDLLEGCLISIYRYPPPCDFEVVVVDNASSDGSQEIVLEGFPQVHLIESPKNLGFAGANNLAIKWAHGDNLLLLNPDTLILEGSFRHILAALDKYPQAGVVGGKLLNPDRSIQQSYGAFPTLRVVLGFLLSLHRQPNPERQKAFLSRTHSVTKEVDAPVGAFFLVRREAIAEVGLLDEGCFVYVEEIDWCLRIKQKGWKILFYPEAEIIHYGGGSSRQKPAEAFIFWIRSHRVFHRKHYGWLSCQLFNLIIFIELLFRLSKNLLLFLVTFRKEARNKVKATWIVFQGAFCEIP